MIQFFVFLSLMGQFKIIMPPTEMLFVNLWDSRQDQNKLSSRFEVRMTRACVCVNSVRNNAINNAHLSHLSVTTSEKYKNKTQTNWIREQKEHMKFAVKRAQAREAINSSNMRSLWQQPRREKKSRSTEKSTSKPMANEWGQPSVTTCIKSVLRFFVGVNRREMRNPSLRAYSTLVFG